MHLSGEQAKQCTLCPHANKKHRGYYFPANCTQMKRFFEELTLFVVDHTRLNTPLHNTLNCMCRLMKQSPVQSSFYEKYNLAMFMKLISKVFPAKKSPSAKCPVGGFDQAI